MIKINQIVVAAPLVIIGTYDGLQLNLQLNLQPVWVNTTSTIMSQTDVSMIYIYCIKLRQNIKGMSVKITPCLHTRNVLDIMN